MEKRGNKICCQCAKKIDLKKDMFVLLGTYNRKFDRPDEELYYHFSCFVDWYNEKVREKAKNQVQGMQKQAMKLMDHPAIKGILEQIRGGDQLMQMVNLDLDAVEKAKAEDKQKITIEDAKKRVLEKLKDGKKREKGKK